MAPYQPKRHILFKIHQVNLYYFIEVSDHYNTPGETTDRPSYGPCIRWHHRYEDPEVLRVWGDPKPCNSDGRAEPG